MLGQYPVGKISSTAGNDGIHISGAGPAGLTAAITLAQAGRSVIVHERKPTVGARFHGDFQGQENWTSRVDVLTELQSMGIESDYAPAPFHALTAFDADGQAFHFSSGAPLFYLVQRGKGAGSLDSHLLRQAEGCGVEIRFGDEIEALPAGGICAEGPKAGDVIAVGYQFETALADHAYAALSDDLAPKGYAYLLIHRGQATLACCMFDDFHNEQVYLNNTVDFFQRKVGVSVGNDARRFGGLGNISYPATARKGDILYVGEAAGFQDALWGFGIRYAITSGYLAAQAWLHGHPESYDGMWRQKLGPRMRAGIVNRYLFSKLGNKGYRYLLQRIAMSGDTRDWLWQYHQEKWLTRLLFPWANRALTSKRKENLCPHPGCNCTWCKCRHVEDALARQWST